MQEAETISDERPRRAAQVVPLEPSLRNRRRNFVILAFLTVLTIVNIRLVFETELLRDSFFNSVALCSIFCLLISLFSRSHWSKLNQRRQQAARYNLAVGVRARATTPDLPALPDSFAIDIRPRWFAIYALVLCSGLFFVLIMALTYSYGQDMFQSTQHGVPMALVVLEISLNIATLLFATTIMLITFVRAPYRQQLIATSEGLTCRRGLRTNFIPWQQACLFAIIGQASTGKQESLLFYELASRDTVIRWPSAYRFVNQGWGTTVPNAVTWRYGLLAGPAAVREFPQQIQFLNILVAEYTGLPLYDLR
jgi:hypothetical protein